MCLQINVAFLCFSFIPAQIKHHKGIFTVGYASNADRISPLFTRTRYNLPRYSRSLFGCFFACHRNIKQFIVKRKVRC